MRSPRSHTFWRAVAFSAFLSSPFSLMAQQLAGTKTATQTATRSASQLQATLINDKEYTFADERGTSCRDHGDLVLQRMRRTIVDQGGTRTQIRCARVELGGRAVKLTNHEATIDEDELWSGEPYYAPPDSVITYHLFGSFGLWSFAGSSLVDADGSRLLVRSENYWRRAQEIEDYRDYWFECPENMAIVAIEFKVKRGEGAFFICAELWQGNPQPTSPAGVITFRDKEDIPCAIPVPGIGRSKSYMSYMLGQRNSPCKTDWAASIELEEVASATRIRLTDSDSCEKKIDENWHFWIELQTIEKSTTMSQINLEEFFGYTPGQIVEKGVKLVDFQRRGSETAGAKLSCVLIETSAAPPAG